MDTTIPNPYSARAQALMTTDEAIKTSEQRHLAAQVREARHAHNRRAARQPAGVQAGRRRTLITLGLASFTIAATTSFVLALHASGQDDSPQQDQPHVVRVAKQEPAFVLPPMYRKTFP